MNLFLKFQAMAAPTTARLHEITETERHEAGLSIRQLIKQSIKEKKKTEADRPLGAFFWLLFLARQEK
jgi:hypothetical protein